MTTARLLPQSCTPLTIPRTSNKETAMRLIRERLNSAYALLPEEEYRDGVERAERDLPEVVTIVHRYLFISAIKPGREV